MDDFALALGPTVGDLAKIARSAGEEKASRATIHGWTRKGWVLRPRQSARKWRYPNAAVGQVDAVARMRARNIHDDFFPFALYVESGVGDLEAARSFVLEYLALWKEAVAREAERFADGPRALRAEAEAAARKRGKNAPLPHRVRTTLDERTKAIEFALAKFASAELPLDEQEHGQFHFERVVGLRSGRGGATRDITAFTLSPNEWPTNTDELMRAVRTASAEQMELARRGVELGVMWLPALRSIIAQTVAGVAFADVVGEWAQTITPDVYPLLFSILRDAQERASAAQVPEALVVPDAAALTAELIAGLPPNQAELVRRRLRPYPRLRLAAHAGLLRTSPSRR